MFTIILINTMKIKNAKYLLKLNSIVTELFIRSRKLNISLVFITQPYFTFPKDARLNSTIFYNENPK